MSTSPTFRFPLKCKFWVSLMSHFYNKSEPAQLLYFNHLYNIFLYIHCFYNCLITDSLLSWISSRISSRNPSAQPIIFLCLFFNIQVSNPYRTLLLKNCIINFSFSICYNVSIPKNWVKQAFLSLAILLSVCQTKIHLLIWLTPNI